MSHENVEACKSAISSADIAIKRLTIQLGVKRQQAIAQRLNELFLELEIEFETSKNSYNIALQGRPSPIDRPAEHLPQQEALPRYPPLAKGLLEGSVRPVKSVRAAPDADEDAHKEKTNGDKQKKQRANKDRSDSSVGVEFE